MNLRKTMGEGESVDHETKELTIVGDIVDDNDAVRSTVIGRGDGMETFVS